MKLAAHPAEAQRLIRWRLQWEPSEAAAYFNLGLALDQQQRISAAVRAYRFALALSNSDSQLRPLVQRNLAEKLLLLGAFREGWPLYGQSREQESERAWRALAGEPWQGIWDPRPLKRLIVVADQALEETLLLCRLGLTLNRHLALPVQLVCPQALEEVLREGTSLEEVNPQLNPASPQEPGTRWCSLRRLPEQMRVNPASTTHQVPYLKANPARVAHWQTRLRRRAGHRLVALHWPPGLMASQALKQLAALQAVEFVRVRDAEPLGHSGLAFVRGEPMVSASMDFRDTAAVLAQCDLLISPDSAVVHLAGAMGLPTWVALSPSPHWCWGLHSERTPWYPSLRLFRQPEPGHWLPVIEAMVKRWFAHPSQCAY